MKPDLGKVVIIGGQGQLGRLFGQMFGLSGYRVETLEQGTGRALTRSSPMRVW